MNTYPRPSSSQTLPAPVYEPPPPPPSSMASSLAPQGPFPPPSALAAAPPSRPGSGLQMAHLLHPPPTQVMPMPTSSPYAHSYDSASGSPADRASILTEGTGSLPDAPSLVPSVVGSAGQPQQKRAYRQRRKDPSCDACRERKVKCDASESSSCTECSNRKVRCQFTKETNRRMSSIKQVQDLEKQLTTTKQQLNQLRSGVMRSENAMDIDFDISGQPVLKLPDVGHRPPRRSRPPVPQDLSGARSSIRNFGRNVIKVPPPYRQTAPSHAITDNAPALPPKPVADRLLGQYHACVHSVLPIIHWPSFTAEYEQVYQTGTLRGARREWTAVLFGVFACGTMHTLEPNKEQEARSFLLTSQGVADTWLDDFNLDQARVTLLVSIALYEMNSRSASWVWLGTAVRISQDIGLHMESGPWPAVEAEMRKRLWWGIYAWDRLLSLELGKPISIHDQDCDVDLPLPIDEKYISEAPRIPEGLPANPLLAIIHVVRSIGQLTKTLRSPVISAATLEIFDRHFNACLATFPIEYHPKSDHYLHPSSLAPIIYLQNARLILHRHNISPHCPAEIRYPAFDHCLAIAIDTTRVLRRCMEQPPLSSAYTLPQGDWQTLLASSATTLLCTHIWRCLLFLIFREDFAAASICIQACKAIGNAHVVMNSHGRYVSFFLKCLLERLQHGNGQALDRDEEIIAYVSGDMQGTTDGSWVWQGSETGSKLETIPAQTSPSAPVQNVGNASERDLDWEGWDWVERTVDYLANELRRRNQERREAPVVAPRPVEPQKLSPESVASSGNATRSSPSSSRMTIANII